MVSPARRRFPIALLSDFGCRDHYTGVMKGVIASIAPEASVIDLTHGIPAQSVAAGGVVLGPRWGVFSPEKVFFVGVGPGGGAEGPPPAGGGRPGGRLLRPGKRALFAPPP